MDTFINITGWSQSHSPSTSTSTATTTAATATATSTASASPRPSYFGHFRSLSLTGSPKPRHSRALSLSPSPSASATPVMPVMSPSGPSGLSNSLHPSDDTTLDTSSPLPSIVTSPNPDGTMTTLHDPRQHLPTSPPRSPTHSGQQQQQQQQQNNGHNDEIATLSAKLINAMNYQTNLDDSLTTTRRDLDASRDRVRELEDQIIRQREMLSGDVWVRRSTVDSDKKALQSRAADERRLRHTAEAEKRRIELELENLTAALFEEANKMVIAAKEEARASHDALRRRNEQLTAQLVDCEGLLRSQQDQLAELKHVMGQMEAEREDQPNNSNNNNNNNSGCSSNDNSYYNYATNAPSSPTTLASVSNQLSPQPPPFLDPISPTHPMGFSRLLQPVLRTDLSSFDDFVSLARLPGKRAGSRVSSGSAGSGMPSTLVTTTPGPGSVHATGSVASLLAATSPQAPVHHQTFLNHVSAPLASSQISSAAVAVGPLLKDTRFFKRVLVEDIEPTLRLDAAPGLSWLARRTVLNSISEGTLVVEPQPTASATTATSSSSSPSLFRTSLPPQQQPCCLCGESRNDPDHSRTHRFRTSEAESAQRAHPLCPYCLNRVRSTCDFVGFLRIVRDGHWKVDGADGEVAAWEESVRLREQMFWARIGGGVIPTGLAVAGFDGDRSNISSRRPSRDNNIRDSNDAGAEETEGEGEEHDGIRAEATADEIGSSTAAVAVTTGPEVQTSTSTTPTGSSRNSMQSLDTKSAGGASPIDKQDTMIGAHDIRQKANCPQIRSDITTT